jgi:elongation factor Ts
MTISMEQVKALRDQTGISIMQCKKALEEAGGDNEKALLVLRKQSGVVAEKKADRDAKDGVIITKNANGKALIFTLHSETDFVAKNDEFQALANKLALAAFESGVEAMKAQSADEIPLVVQKVGENIQLGEIIEVSGENLGVYNHGGKSAVIVSLSGGSESLAKDIAMHVAAMKPKYIQKSDAPADAVEKARAFFEEEVAKENKPAEIKEKILTGKLDTYFKEITLVEQPFIKDPSKTIGQLLKEAGAEIQTFYTKTI